MKKLVRNLVDEAVEVVNSLANPQQNRQGYQGGPQAPQYPYQGQQSTCGYPGYPVPQGPPYAQPNPASYYPPPPNTQHAGAPPNQPYHHPTSTPQGAYPAQQPSNPTWNYPQPTAYTSPSSTNTQAPYSAPAHPYTQQYPPANPAPYGVPAAPSYHAQGPVQTTALPSHQHQYGPPPPPHPNAPYGGPPTSQPHHYYPPPPPAPAPQQTGVTSPSPQVTPISPPAQSPTGPQQQAGYFTPAPGPHPQASFPQDTSQTVHTPQSSGPPSYQNYPSPPQGNAASNTGAPAAPRDSIANLSSRMSKLNVQPGVHSPPPQYENHISEDDRPRGPAPMRATGLPNEVIPDCPGVRQVDYTLDWYLLPEIPEFLICTRCYEDHIKKTSLAGHFEKTTQPDGSVSLCLFWLPRVKGVLWPQAVQSNNLNTLRAYMSRRLGIPACAARAGAESSKWYTMAQSGVIDEFVACEACYEDRIIGTPFETRFGPSHPQGQNDLWICDVSLPYLTEALAKMSKANDWQGFVDAAKQRLKLPECEGKTLPHDSVNWFVPRREIKEMRICETCYLDKLALSRFSNEFVPCSSPPGHVEGVTEEASCDLAPLPLGVALDAALYERNFYTFWNAAQAIVSLVPCTENGIIRGNWWTINRCDALSVCEACYNGILKTTDMAQYFGQAKRDPTASIVCSFCPASLRFVQFLNRFAEALDKGVITYFSNYVTRWAGVPSCPGVKDMEKGKWWGYRDVLCCQDCWLSFVSNTSLADSMPLKAVYNEKSQICQYWSPRMRRMWLDACNAGPTGSSESDAAMEKFKAFGIRRMEVYIATIPLINYMEQMKLLKMQSAMHQGTLSMMYQHMDGMAVLAGTADGRLHGSNSLGWYNSEDGVTAAQMRQNMSSGLANANRPDEVMEIIRLKTMWAEVE